jgi:GDP-L-fucose synthase
VSTVFKFEGRRIWVAGSRGMLGSSLVRHLAGTGCDVVIRDREALDLRDQRATFEWMAGARLDAVLMCAATVGGIRANAARPADFLVDNLSIELNVLEGAHRAGIDRVVFLGSSCMYPRAATQPISEDTFLTGPLEPTNEAYAIAKIAGVSLVRSYRRQFGRSYITAVPTNLYGPGDDFLSGDGHVVAAMFDRFHRARVDGVAASPLWGSGAARREFLFVDDAAEAILRLLATYDDDALINVAGGTDVSILELARLVAEVVGYEGPITTDPSFPDGMPLKSLDPSRMLAMGWRARTSLASGLAIAYRDYRRALAGSKPDPALDAT